MRALVFRLLVAATIALALPALASADVVFRGTFPLSNTFTNPCNGELVNFSVTERVLVSNTFDSSGGEHINTAVTLQETGTGATTGTNYVGNAHSISTESVNSGETATSTSRFTFNVISQGSAPNFIEHGVAHTTINPDGTVTSLIDTLSTECTGKP